MTINSNNSFNQITGTAITNKDTDQAVSIVVVDRKIGATNDATSCGRNTFPCHATEGIIEAGTVTLTGTGGTKRGRKQGDQRATPHTTARNNIEMTGSTLTMVGDNSIGVLEDQLATLNGQSHARP